MFNVFNRNNIIEYLLPRHFFIQQMLSYHTLSYNSIKILTLFFIYWPKPMMSEWTVIQPIIVVTCKRNWFSMINSFPSSLCPLQRVKKEENPQQKSTFIRNINILGWTRKAWLKITIFAIYSPFLLPSFFWGEEKRGKE
jgi:hypothetical protein